MGIPHYDGASLSGVGKGYLEKPAAAMALRAACSGLSNKTNNDMQLKPIIPLKFKLSGQKWI